MSPKIPAWISIAATGWLIGGLPAWVEAGSLGWYLPPFQPQLLSDGMTPIPAGTVFQLGVFADSFVPDASNRADWAAKWRAADFANYQTEESVIDGYYTVEVNAPPFTAGTQMYVWGVFLKADGTSEQWLGTASTWQVPTDDPMAFPDQIEIDDATSVLLGAANSEAGTLQMAAVAANSSLPVIYGDPWRRHFFTLAEMANPAIGDWQADPDRDGLSNALEFGMGLNPLAPQSGGSTTLQAQAGAFLMTLPGWQAAAVTVGVVESDTLQPPWQPLSPGPVFNPGLSRWERILAKTGQQNFFRMEITIPDMP